MIQKTLSQLARELGVSVSYLSQVRSGKRPASKRVAEAMSLEGLSSVNQYVDGAGGGSRTHKDQGPADFKSAASANSATPAHIGL